MTTRITTSNIDPTALIAIQGPIISSIQVTSNNYVVLDDTAVDTAGGFIRINGNNFTSSTQVIIGSQLATSVTFVNSSTLNVQVPAQSAGTYTVYVTNNNGDVAIMVMGVTYSPIPAWSTGSTLPGGVVNNSLSIQLNASGDGSITYAVANGSSLPPGLTLSSNGLLSGAVTGITSETTYNFNINAIDAQLQDAPRTFSITILANDPNFRNSTTLLSASNPSSNFVTDVSANSFAITVNGDARPSNFGPYTPGYYSGSFSSGGISWPGSAALALGTGDFTIECWVNYTSEASRFLTNRVSFSAGSGTWSWSFNSTSIAFVTVIPGEPGVSNSSVSIPTNRWNHLAVVRSSGVITFYVNGTSFAGGSFGYDLGNTDQSYLLGSTSEKNGYNFTGFISNLRILKGTALYTSSFTPSTTPLTAVANTQLLICQSNRFRDESNNNVALTPSSATITGFDPFVPSASFAGRGSGFFDGTGDYLSAPSASNGFGTGDFTIEAWFYKTGNGTTIVSNQDGGSDNNYFVLDASNANAVMQIRDGAGQAFAYGPAVVNNTWTHIAVTRSSGSVRVFINGVSGTAVTITKSITSRLTIIGAFLYAGFEGYFSGHISNLRIINGTALYTTNFTPPTEPLTAIANTRLLTLQNNQPNNNSMFLDNSTNNFNITRNGNTTQGTFSPYGGGWSVNFPNSGVLNAQSTSGAHLTAPNSTAFDMGTGDFTMEGWIYPQSLPSSDNWPSNWWQTSSLFGRGTANLGDGYNLILGATRLIFQNSDTNVTNGLHNMVVNNWYHVAACRSSGTLRLFVNGTQVASASFTSSVGGGSNFFIGCETGQGAYFNGYMSNIRVLKGTALYTTNFTPSTTPLTPIANTSILTCADNRFIDDSPNNFAITVNNSATIQRFNPFSPLTTTPTSYSGFFDGTGDYLLGPSGNSAFAMGTGDFTLECWLYLNAKAAGTHFFSVGDGSGTTWLLGLNNTPVFEFYAAGATRITGTTNPTLGVWYHVAISRVSGSTRLFVNGVQEGSTYSDNNNYTCSSGFPIIGIRPDLSSTPMNGHMSNLRVIKGTAIYTTNFTPSTTPLTAIANTQLLTCQSATFIDSSNNNFTITAVGDTVPRQFNPFGWTNITSSSAAYTPALYGGSAFFDGTGDFLDVSSNIAFNFGTGNFTIELWAYFTSISGSTPNIIDMRSGGNPQTALTLYLNNGTLTLYVSGSNRIVGSALAANIWYHIALVRNSGSTNLYVNGIRVGTAYTDTNNYGTQPVRIFASNDGGTVVAQAGYCSDVRIVKGQALYTSNFQPPVAPLTALQNTVLLNNMTSAGIYDSNMMNTFETFGNVQTTTRIKPYGNSSIFFDGTGDYLVSPASPTNVLGSGNFTIEGWIYPSNTTTAYRAIVASENYSATTGGWSIWQNGTAMEVWLSPGGSSLMTATAVLTANTWHHFAVVRSGSTVTLYVGGTSRATATNSASWTGQRIWIGDSTGTPDYFFVGHMSDIRITNGVARYTTTFTPPTAPFIQF